MPAKKIERDLKAFLSEAYPNITVRVAPWKEDETRLALYFIEEKFALLYPQQRYHYLIHNIPNEYFRANLENTVWFELAPGENPEDLYYADEELMISIAPDVLRAVEGSGAIAALDDLLCPVAQGKEPEQCHGDFRHLKSVLTEKGFKSDGDVDEISDICHVMMSKGAFCDCEILYNVIETSRLKTKYWQTRANSAQQGGQADAASRRHLP